MTKELYYLAGVISEQIWGRLPGGIQQRLSAFAGRLFESPVSRFLIRPYCKIYYNDSRYHHRFVPGNGQPRYRNFQDFFTRDFLHPPQVQADQVWPCEGYLCDRARVDRLKMVKVKRDTLNAKMIFGRGANEVPDHAYFSNVFLHNRNYHHIHAPVSGTVRWVERVPGELLLLRPWAYRNKPSLPAFTNERVNTAIRDDYGRDWFLSIVGGPVVGSIRALACLQAGQPVIVGQKIATFELGSTCCMISPVEPSAALGEMVAVGEMLSAEQPAVYPELQLEA